ncbi:hypothetical protein M1437_00525, partial [Patescibacteria group bacterium]|nr:hypothetical protein [Patescibacteria group bacterium]
MRSRSKNTIVTVGLILLLVVVSLTIFKYAAKKDPSLADPQAKSIVSQKAAQPTTPPYNPPKEIKYDSFRRSFEL